MKRSEMIEKLYKVLLHINSPYTKDGVRVIKNPHLKEVTETIISSMEEEGMLPPECNWLSMEQMDKLYPDYDWRENSFPRKNVNIWEPEDEN